MYYCLKNRVDGVQLDQKEPREIADNKVTQAYMVNKAMTVNLVRLVIVVNPGRLALLVRAYPFTCTLPTKSMMMWTTLLMIAPTGQELG